MHAFLPRIVVALTIALALGACSDRAKPGVENAVRPVQVVRVVLRPAGEERAFTGTIRARREADIAFRAGGRMAAREVDLGDRVRAGQVLARLDPTDLALGVRSAEADLSSAEAQAAQAISDAARSRTLLAQGWVPAATDETKQAAARSARQRVVAAQAARQLARNRHDYAVLRAPADGVVTGVLADPGTVVAEGQPVLRLAEAGALEADVALPENVVGEAARAVPSVTVWARPDTVLAATLREVSPAADPKLRTYTARYAITEPPDWLGYGMTATVRLATAGGEALADIPASAVSDRGDGPIVWVVDPARGTLEKRGVALRRLRQDRALVAGLRQDELVVELGVQKLDPGARVRVAEIRPAGA
jgi:membrane fusion protein, multidrug efflux system